MSTFSTRYCNNVMITLKYDQSCTNVMTIVYLDIVYTCTLSVFDKKERFLISNLVTDITNKILTHAGASYILTPTTQPDDFTIYRYEHIIRQLVPKHPFHQSYSALLHATIYEYMLMTKPHLPLHIIPADYLVSYPIDNQLVLNTIDKARTAKWDLNDFMKSIRDLGGKSLESALKDAHFSETSVSFNTEYKSSQTPQSPQSPQSPHTSQTSRSSISIAPKKHRERFSMSKPHEQSVSKSPIPREPSFVSSVRSPLGQLDKPMRKSLQHTPQLTHQTLTN